ncbi:hypothetical protein SFBSU_006G698 [Candidatus Arthromitus sp. SFB-mouse-SU]|nr:hypothetical protein SFB1_055G38 [Candidatus Arthromitus sp. SFB-1]EIA28771.1 hypothetical protein SFB6_030G41 [Candidatus Arthromitus sp. SFB-co]EIA31017.1 hypothetical protein SFBSU_006G698 [Candidatus Arthromitus sp. SFB-mouse-SU]
MVLTLIFSLIMNSNYMSKNISTYLDYENISEVGMIDPINNFISKLKIYKDDYYRAVDESLIVEGVTFLDYIKNNNIKLFKGNLYILNFSLGNIINPNGDKILLYYSDEDKKGYYFYAKENGRDINLDLARIFRI